jgi:hypothetical protein
VLVDIVFPYSRKDDHFVRTKDVIANAKAPLFMVVDDQSTEASRQARQEIFNLRDTPGVGLTLVSGDVGDHQQPLLSLSNDKEYKPAALAIFQTVCEKIKDATCPKRDLSDAGGAVDGMMEVAWGMTPARFNCQRADSNIALNGLCDDLLSWPLGIGRAVQLLWEGLLPTRWRQTDPLRIPYHAVISTADLLDGGQREHLDSLLRGKIVIYGAEVTSQNDYVFSPVHGQIAGAFIHAMALDNLLTFGNRYFHRGASGETFHREWTEFQATVLMLLAALAIGWNRHRLLRTDALRRDARLLSDADDRFLQWVRGILIGVAIVLFLVEFFVYRISPFNWLALLVVFEVAHRVERWFFDPSEWRTRSVVVARSKGSLHEH